MKSLQSLAVFMYVVSIVISSMYFPAMTTSAATPHAILGFVYDMDEVGIMGATVFINNTRNNISQNMVTDSLGRYSLDMNIDSGFSDTHVSDILMLTAVYSGQSSTDTLVVSSVPYQQLNFTFAIRTHVIDGYVKRALDGTVARYFNVQVTNKNTNESKTSTTGQDGYYRMELSTFSGGFTMGDEIWAYVNQAGFVGDNYTFVSSNPLDRMNITLYDLIKPVFRDGEIYEAPESIDLSQEYRILSWVTDVGSGLASVKLLMKKKGESIYSEYNMLRDNGVSVDWNSDGKPNTQIWGQSTAMAIPLQTAMGDLYYYINATDISGNFATLPAVDPKNNPLQIKVVDPVMPTLTHTPITWAEAGLPREIVATANDNMGIDAVSLFYKGVGQTSFTKVAMSLTGDPNQYNASIPAQSALGTLNYYLACNDTSNNTVRLPATGDWPVTVEDTTVPKMIHTKINSANVGDPINFTCRVSDVLLDAVWLNFTDVHGDEHNHPMLFDPGTDKWYHLNETGQNDTGPFNLNYTVWAEDTSGNLAKISHSFPVLDAGTPWIVHDPPGFLEFNISTPIHAYVGDDLTVSNVSLAYRPAGSADYTISDMDSADYILNHGNFTAEIPPRTSFDPVQYLINATDGFNCINWPSLEEYYEIEVRDTTPPALSGLTYSVETPSGLGTGIRVNVTDAHSVASVKLYYLNSTAASWTPVAMALNGSATYEGIIPPHPPGRVKFYIWANDSSNNSATFPVSTPKLSPFFINFTDDSLPELELMLPASLGVNRSAEVFFNATDDNAVSSVGLHFKSVWDSAFSSLELSKVGVDSYKGTIPAQNRSGEVQLYVSASDGVNWNQTESVSIPVINSPPSIGHMPLDVVPLDVPFSVTADVSDDLRVENVSLEWKLSQGPSTVQPMSRRASGFYRANLSFSEPA
ncbi:MAG: carboxypeptidase-like regulatory domain-containing protein, partial [Thermoplasmata archaeon]